MPIYEYKCVSCDKVIEKIRRMSDDTPVECDCGDLAEKVISRPGRPKFIGSGFYQNDYENAVLDDLIREEVHNS